MRIIIYLVLFASVFFISSCNTNSHSLENKEEVDSSMFIKDGLRYGDTITSLVINGVVSQNIKQDGYLLVDNTLGGVSFDKAEVHVKSDNTIWGVSFVLHTSNPDEMQSAYNKVTKYMYNKYGKAASDTTENSIIEILDEKVEKRTISTFWNQGDNSISLFMASDKITNSLIIDYVMGEKENDGD